MVSTKTKMCIPLHSRAYYVFSVLLWVKSSSAIFWNKQFLHLEWPCVEDFVVYMHGPRHHNKLCMFRSTMVVLHLLLICTYLMKSCQLIKSITATLHSGHKHCMPSINTILSHCLSVIIHKLYKILRK